MFKLLAMVSIALAVNSAFCRQLPQKLPIGVVPPPELQPPGDHEVPSLPQPVEIYDTPVYPPWLEPPGDNELPPPQVLPPNNEVPLPPEPIEPPQIVERPGCYVPEFGITIAPGDMFAVPPTNRPIYYCSRITGTVDIIYDTPVYPPWYEWPGDNELPPPQVLPPQGPPADVSPPVVPPVEGFEPILPPNYEVPLPPQPIEPPQIVERPGCYVPEFGITIAPGDMFAVPPTNRPIYYCSRITGTVDIIYDTPVYPPWYEWPGDNELPPPQVLPPQGPPADVSPPVVPPVEGFEPILPPNYEVPLPPQPIEPPQIVERPGCYVPEFGITIAPGDMFAVPPTNRPIYYCSRITGTVDIIYDTPVYPPWYEPPGDNELPPPQVLPPQGPPADVSPPVVPPVEGFEPILPPNYEVPLPPQPIEPPQIVERPGCYVPEFGITIAPGDMFAVPPTNRPIYYCSRITGTVDIIYDTPVYPPWYEWPGDNELPPPQVLPPQGPPADVSPPVVPPVEGFEPILPPNYEVPLPPEPIEPPQIVEHPGCYVPEFGITIAPGDMFAVPPTNRPIYYCSRITGTVDIIYDAPVYPPWYEWPGGNELPPPQVLPQEPPVDFVLPPVVQPV